MRTRADGGYELIAGERRWRAAQRAGLHEVPVVVREVAPTQAFELALVENLQREDLNPIEEAAGYERLVAEFGYTQEKLADRVGKDRSTIANALRLLRLPDGVRALVAEGRLSMGHARALLGLESAPAMEQLARRTRRAGSVGAQGRGAGAPRAHRGRARRPSRTDAAAPSASARDLAMKLTRALGTRVAVVEAGPGSGQIVDSLQLARRAGRATGTPDAPAMSEPTRAARANLGPDAAGAATAGTGADATARRRRCWSRIRPTWSRDSSRSRPPTRFPAARRWASGW